MDDERASGTAPVPVPTDSPRDLLDVTDSEWLAECDRWLTVEVKRTFALVRNGVVLDPEALKNAALDLSGLSNALTVAADKHGLESRLLWEFGACAGGYATTGELQHLGKASDLIHQVSGLVISLRNRLALAERQQRDPGGELPKWKILETEERKSLIMELAKEKDVKTLSELARRVAKGRGTEWSAVRSWVQRRAEFHEQVVRALQGRPAK